MCCKISFEVRSIIVEAALYIRQALLNGELVECNVLQLFSKIDPLLHTPLNARNVFVTSHTIDSER